jgi:nucleoside-diphosphate-sugar epimerase
MSTLVTGAFGRVGTALIDHGTNTSGFTYLDTVDHPEIPSTVADVADYPLVAEAASGCDALVHLAAVSRVDAAWPSVLRSNIVGAYNCFEVARRETIETVVFTSSNHVVGMYEQEHAPALYDPDYDLTLDGDEQVRPDSYYGTSKAFGESLGRYYVENYAYPKRVYVLRIGSVRWPDEDHPYADAERGVSRGEWSCNSEPYEQEVDRLKATWLSRRDAARLVDSCLEDDSVTYGIFYGTSDNDRSWFDIGPARDQLGYSPASSGDDWTSPPSDRSIPESSVAHSVAPPSPR